MKKLSEAMREGAKQRPQAFGEYRLIEEHNGSLVSCTCALGAAYEGMTGELPPAPPSTLWEDGCLVERILLRKTGISRLDRIVSPAEPIVMGFVFEIVSSLNDDHRWTREKIADWLESHGL